MNQGFLKFLRFPGFLRFLWVPAGLVACSGTSEPGSPALDPSPLFGNYASFRTVAELQHTLPDRSTWRILADSASPSREDCPRFVEFTFAFDGSHLGHDGRVQLMFINDRLHSTIFTPDDFDSYARALERSGMRFDANGQATVAPATHVWQTRPNAGESGRIGWVDTRFRSQVDAWLESCA